MLDLRPNCECCDKDLPPATTEAMICTYECTFCINCVESVLSNVCPNCGGGFSPRPIRPAIEHRKGLSTLHQPPSNRRVRTKYSKEELKALADPIKSLPPEKR
ncbi:DUF1272 domain-containing protein [Kiloniella antarctica]|uniref:DUF1272 domain-containing protein n=1 Tax=Kiloniella antarctica TaxID=1550907 RepID=A0ABW5BF96_9PROT